MGARMDLLSGFGVLGIGSVKSAQDGNDTFTSRRIMSTGIFSWR